MSVPNPPSLFNDIPTRNFEAALNPRLCIYCTTRDTGNELVNTLCDHCENTMDPMVKLVHKEVFKVYEFWLEVRRNMFGDTIYQDDKSAREEQLYGDLGDRWDIWGSWFRHVWGRSNEPTTLHYKNQLQNGSREMINLSESQKQMVEECLLAGMQCQSALIVLTDLIEEVFLKDPNSPVTGIREIGFSPKHPGVQTHLTYLFKIRDSNEEDSAFFVNFTDRQLGWLPLVRPADQYMENTLPDGKIRSDSLGTQRESVSAERSTLDKRVDECLDDEEKRQIILDQERDELCVAVSRGVVGRYDQWRRLRV